MSDRRLYPVRADVRPVDVIRPSRQVFQLSDRQDERPAGPSPMVARAVVNVLVLVGAVVVVTIAVTFVLFTLRLWRWLA